MLSLMPSTPVADFHHATPPLTMSLAVLPHAPPSAGPVSGVHRPVSVPSTRPKLTLNTQQLPTALGKSTTSLRLETLSAASPTSRNTFNNAFGRSQSAPIVPKRPDLSINPRPSTPHSATPTPLRTCSSDSVVSSSSSVSSATSAVSTISTSSEDSLPPPVPYRLPFNHKSILTNSPVPRLRKRRSFASARPMFPSPKRVSFKAELTEDIVTSRYTLAHSDIDSSISTLELPPPRSGPVQITDEIVGEPESMYEVEKPGAGQQQDEVPLAPVTKEPKSPMCGDKRDSSEDEDSDTCPSTPITRRSKKPREWRWTLGPISPRTNPEEQGDKPPEDSTEESSSKQ